MTNQAEWDAMPDGDPKTKDSKVYYVTHVPGKDLTVFQRRFLDNWKSSKKTSKWIKQKALLFWRLIGSFVVYMFINHSTSHLLRYWYGQYCFPGLYDFFDSIFYKHLSPVCQAITWGMSACETNMWNLITGAVALKVLFPNSALPTIVM